MASHKHNIIFKTPQKSGNDTPVSPPLKLHQNRYRGPLANIQNISSMVTSRHFTSGSSVAINSHKHCTPPRGFFKIKNPFEKHLIDNLHTPICSPGMFKIRESETGSFKWDIEHVSVLKPADIEPCNSQFDPSPDPQLEEKATKAIERFFSQEMIVPSPMDEAPKRNILLPMDSKDEQTTPEGTKSATREVWTQTALTFPVDLPPEIENTLKSFCTFSKEQIGVAEADLSANASLRRKLCFEEIYSDVEEEEIHMSVHNISCPVFHSPQMNPSLSGFKRNFDTPQSKYLKNIVGTPGNCKMLSEDELIGFSPIAKASATTPRPSDSKECLQSPSVSPIHKSSNEKMSLSDSPETSEKASRACDTSPFSQSTPEKSSLTSKSSIKSSPETSEGSDVPLQYRRNIKNAKYFKFTDDMCNIAKDEIRIARSNSEISIASFERSRSAIKLDFSMDVSCENSMHLCGEQSVIAGSDPSSPRESVSNDYWDLEMAQIDKKCDKCDIGVNICGELVQEHLCNCQSAMDERLKEVYQYLTPTKNKNGENDEINSSINKTCSSPMQMSPSCSFPTQPDVFRKSQFIGSHFNLNVSRSLGDCSSSAMGSTSFFKESQFIKSHLTTSTMFERKDSGYNERFEDTDIISKGRNQDMTLCNSTVGFADITKGQGIKKEASSNVSWKRFDSGFNEETSSDFSQHTSHNDTSTKYASQKYTPIMEYYENKENIYFQDFHNAQESKATHEAMSVSDIFPEDVSFACNFSSTPSKSRLYKTTK